MFENPRRGRQARNFTTNVPKILVLKSSSEQIFSKNWRSVSLIHWLLFKPLYNGHFLLPQGCKEVQSWISIRRTCLSKTDTWCHPKGVRLRESRLYYVYSLRASSLGRSGCRAGKGRRACNSVSGIWIPPPIPCGSSSTELSNFRQSARSGNERECKQTLKNTCQG